MNEFFWMLSHAGHVSESGFFSGMSHPVTGLDHLLAMVAVGLLAVRGVEGVAWKLPLAFLGGMIAGGLLGLFPLMEEPFEPGIALSVSFFGLLLLWRHPALERLAPGLIAGFALFHGHAHVMEGPTGTGLWLYSAGFVSGTAVLLGGGILLGLIFRELPRVQNWGIRLAGTAAVIFGLIFLVA
jgi:urease accessory protein